MIVIRRELPRSHIVRHGTFPLHRVYARVLLAVAVLPGTRTFQGHYFLRSCRRWKMAGYRPDKSGQLSGDGRDRNLRRLILSHHPRELSVQARFRLSRDENHLRRATFTALFHGSTQASATIRPSGLDQYAPDMGVARFGD